MKNLTPKNVWPKKLEMWECSDSKKFENKINAHVHEEKLRVIQELVMLFIDTLDNDDDFRQDMGTDEMYAKLIVHLRFDVIKLLERI